MKGRAAAARACRRCGELLDRELGVQPGEATVATYRDAVGGRQPARP